MIGRRITARLIQAGGAFTAALLLGLAWPSSAAACGVSYNYSFVPDFDLAALRSGESIFGDQCSTGTSLSGVVLVLVLVVVLLAGWVTRVVGRDSDPALQRYLSSAGPAKPGNTAKKPGSTEEAR